MATSGSVPSPTSERGSGYRSGMPSKNARGCAKGRARRHEILLVPLNVLAVNTDAIPRFAQIFTPATIA
ncbi:hypothetical protein ATK36_0693 [Amycolatopsis sulphurea]|uniref:Uncharacterized protein n=1 Tax=Amycolatopsis sulphurea TaxID=76022 RepID=A0A2A9G1V3_9PSEU|nr:hypothetical protein ATK36_0693 [Amycolatopsis sulphurea]